MEVDAITTRKRTCYRCGSEGHFIKDCPKPDTRSRGDGKAAKRAEVREVTMKEIEDFKEGDWDDPEDFPATQQ
jgi:hypothetical protein